MRSKLHIPGSSLSRRGMMQSAFGAVAAALAARPARAVTGGPQVPKNLLWIFANGGWDVTYAMDPKLGVPGTPVEGPEWEETANTPEFARNEVITVGAHTICHNAALRPSVTTFFEDWGAKTLVLNGIWTGSIVHEGCRMRILTGNSLASVPDLPTQIGYRNGAGLPLGSIDMSGLGYAGRYAASTGRIGARSQLKALLDPGSVFQPLDPDPTDGITPRLPLYAPSDAAQFEIDQFLRNRGGQLQGGGWSDGGWNDQRIADLRESLDRRHLLRQQADTLVGGLTVGTEATLSTQLATAVELLQANMCNAILVSDPDSWDTHDINSLQNDRYENFFKQVNLALAQMAMPDPVTGRVLLDDTMVILASEMTRTPAHNWKGGKDHWAHTSMMFLGAGIDGGRTIGATDENLESMPMDFDTGEAIDPDAFPDAPLMKYDNLAAGILQTFGFDPEEIYPTIEPLRALQA